MITFFKRCLHVFMYHVKNTLPNHDVSPWLFGYTTGHVHYWTYTLHHVWCLYIWASYHKKSEATLGNSARTVHYKMVVIGQCTERKMLYNFPFLTQRWQPGFNLIPSGFKLPAFAFFEVIFFNRPPPLSFGRVTDRPNITRIDCGNCALIRIVFLFFFFVRFVEANSYDFLPFPPSCVR